MMRLLYCSNPLLGREPDPAYAAEVTAATHHGLPYDLIDYEALLAGDVGQALRRVTAQAVPTTAVYRGWMLRPSHYALLYGALHERGIVLINDEPAYRHCHYLPEWYGVVEGATPPSVWIAGMPPFDVDQIMLALQPFGDRAVILKDYVKSRKHEWYDACFIPSAADRSAVARVVNRFCQLQGDDFQGGLVFREFVPFKVLGTAAHGGMPLVNEYRLFVLDGAVIATVPLWDDATYLPEPVPVQLFAGLLRRNPEPLLHPRPCPAPPMALGWSSSSATLRSLVSPMHSTLISSTSN